MGASAVYAYATNQIGSEIILQLEEISDNSDPTATYSYTKLRMCLTKRGRVADEASAITIDVSGRKRGKQETLLYRLALLLMLASN